MLYEYTYEDIKRMSIFCPDQWKKQAILHPFPFLNKKVLLRERKRHTARRVASTPYVVLTGYPPILTWPGGYPAGGVPDLGTPPSRAPPGRVPPPAGYPLPGRVPPWQGTRPLAGYPPAGYPPGRVPPARVPPHQGTPPARVPPRLDLAGYPPPPPAGPGRVPPPPLRGCPMAFWAMLQSIMGYGYPPRCEQTENITFPILRMRAVMMVTAGLNNEVVLNRNAIFRTYFFVWSFVNFKVSSETESSPNVNKINAITYTK